MKEIVIREPVLYSGTDRKRKNFSGPDDSALSLDERMEFLNKYAAQAADWYEDPNFDTKAVSEEEICAFTDEMLTGEDAHQVRRTVRFDTMQASCVYKQPEYENLHLYAGARVEGETIVFPTRTTRPTPAAMVMLPQPTAQLHVSMRVFIPENFITIWRKEQYGAQPANTIELRCGTLDKVHIDFYNTGNVSARTDSRWEPHRNLLGHVRAGAWNTLDITVGKENVSIVFNGARKPVEVPFIGEADAAIDGIFLGSSKFPRDMWKVDRLCIDGQPFAFTTNTTAEGQREQLGEQPLPYAIGSKARKDQRLYLTGTFTADKAARAILDVETLDPCGKVWLNGQLVLDTDNLLAHSVDVTDALKQGENKLDILVEPRAPEVFYHWHRHTDCYHGWFCGALCLHLTGEKAIDALRVCTRNTDPCASGTVQVQFNTPVSGKVDLFVRRMFDADAKEELLCSAKADNTSVLNTTFSKELALWSDDDPAMYQVRAVLYDGQGNAIDDFVVETGFRTITQKNGEIYLNGKRVLLNGALTMQFLPPYDDVPVNHVCPTTDQLVMQILALKKMNGNFLRLHMLGYGSNDMRFARICDRLGIMLAWITRLIDASEECCWDEPWVEEQAFVEQCRAVHNNPSVVMFEGSNEYPPQTFGEINRLYDTFVSAVGALDDGRLLCPCSHLYYLHAGPAYNDDGDRDLNGGDPFESSFGWKDERVVRSGHPYSILCGYGFTWDIMRSGVNPMDPTTSVNGKSHWQAELLRSKKHAYLATEFAITALANPNTPEAKAATYVESYERNNEKRPIGRWFEQSEWKESQAMQALCAFNAVKWMRMQDVDGMAWCCLSSGANDGSYLKPIIDFYFYKKIGYYGLRDGYTKLMACKGDIDIEYAAGESITPMILRTCQTGTYDLTVRVLDEAGAVVDSHEYGSVVLDGGSDPLYLAPFTPAWTKAGHYGLEFVLKQAK